MKYILVFCFTVCVFSNDCPIVNFNIVWQKTNLDKLRHAKVLDNNLNEAKIVTIQSNQTLDQICKETLSKIPNFDYLFLNDSLIRRIQAESFNQAQDFAVIDLSRNKLEKISPGVFNGLKLRILKLRQNSIQEIGLESFNNMINLIILDLSFNNLEEIPIGLFKNSTKINQIYLGNNRIQSLKANTFLNLRRQNTGTKYDPVSIYLEFNQISTIDEHAFNGLPELGVLDLRGNKITILKSNIFSSVNHVRMMSVARNGLECISNGFDFINKIGNIVLDANSWDCTCLEDLEIWYNNNDLDSTHVSNFDCK